MQARHDDASHWTVDGLVQNVFRPDRNLCQGTGLCGDHGLQFLLFLSSDWGVIDLGDQTGIANYLTDFTLTAASQFSP